MSRPLRSRVHRAFRPSGPLLLAALCLAAPALAQDSRFELIAQKQAEKARNLEPPTPSKAERIVTRVQEALLDAPNHLYPLFGSIYSGGGLALGAGYRTYYGDRSHWDAKGMWSLRNYKWLEVSTDSTGHAADRLDWSARVGWRDATQVAFYGIGTDSDADDRSHFRFKQSYVEASIQAKPAFPLILGGDVAYYKFDTARGLGTHPPVEQRFDPSDVPGLGADVTYLYTSGRAGIDWRRPGGGYSRSGGLYELRYHNFADTDETFSFDRLDAELIQHLPILRANWILSFRGRVQTTLDGGDVVPYFMMPSLGSGSTLRGFSSWRFRDRHSMLGQGEFRWTPNRLGFDMALFYDAGKVTSRRADLDFNDLKTDFGIGMRFHGPGFTPLRIELAHSREGLQLVFTGGAAF